MSARRVGPDFCLIELTEAGIAYAAGHPVRVSNGRISVLVAPGGTTKVARYEWDMLLRDHVTPQGKPMFAIALEAEASELEKQWEAEPPVEEPATETADPAQGETKENA